MSYSQPVKNYDGGQDMSRSASSTDSGLLSLSRQDTPLSLDYYYSAASANMGSSSTSSLTSPGYRDTQSHITSSPLQRPQQLSSGTHSGASSPASPPFFVEGGAPADRFSPSSLSPRLPSPNEQQPGPSPPVSPRPPFGGVLSKRADSINAKGKALSGWMMRKTSSRKTSSGPPTPEPVEGLFQAEQRRNDAPPPRLPEPTADSDDASSGAEDSVVDISWARKMIEDLEADGSSSDGGPHGLGAASSRGDLADADFDSADEQDHPRRSSSSSGSSFYNGTPSSADPPFLLPSPTGSTSFPPPQEPLSPSQDSEVTPRVAQFSSPNSNPSSPSRSSTHTTTNDAHLRHPSGAPFSPGNGSSNRRIAVMEASPGPSPSTSSSSFSDHTPPNQRETSAPMPRGLPEIPSIATTSASSSNLAERRGLSASRLAFVAPPDASKSSIGELRDAMDEMGPKPPRRGSRESASPAGTWSAPSGRTHFSKERDQDVVNLDDDLDSIRSGSRSAGRTPEPLAPAGDLPTVDEDLDGLGEEDDEVRPSSHLREPGMASSPALQAARERAKKARSIHLASLQSMTPPPSASASSSSASSSRPVLSADTSSAAFVKATSTGDAALDSGLWTPAIGDSKELGARVAGPQMIGMPSSNGRSGACDGNVERPKRSDMRTARTPSPTKVANPGSSSQHVREPATNAARGQDSLPTPSPTVATSGHAPAHSPVVAPALDASVSASSISNAQTLEELTAAVDRAINDAEIKESLALRSDFGVPSGSSPEKAARQEISASLRAQRVEEDVGLDFDDYVLVDEPSFTEPSASTLPVPSRPPLNSKSSSTPPANVSAFSPPESNGLFPSPPIDRPVVRRTTSLASLQPSVHQPQQTTYSSKNLPPRATSSMANPIQSPFSSAPYTGLGLPTPVTPQYPVGRVREWPGAMVFTDVRLLRTPGEKANAYARKIAELGRSDSGLGDWVRAHSGYKENEPSRASISSQRPSMASIHPHPASRPSSSLSTSQTYQSSTSLYAIPASRNVSTSSAASDDAFPIRAGHQTAQHLRNVSPPSGPPANLPFPQLAVGMGMRSSASSASVRSGSGGVAGGFLQALGRRGSASGGTRPRFGGGLGKSPPTALAGLPSGGVPSGRLSAESTRRPSAKDIREMGISSPTSWSRGGGGPDGQGPPASTPPVRTTTINGPAGPRGRNPSLPTTASSQTLSASSPTVRRASEMDIPSYPAPPPPPAQSTRSSLSTHSEDVAPPPAPSRGPRDAELREMVEILGEDERVLAGYLRREGDYMAGITAYLEDQRKGSIVRA